MKTYQLAEAAAAARSAQADEAAASPLQRLADESPRSARLREQAGVAQRPNGTGLPDQLKAGIEGLSGISMDHVRVHYGSDKPAQLQAHAYAQGSDIYLGAGQERHLPHEAWHLVQQAQGRVQPTTRLAGQHVNDDASLEAEADAMGARAARHDGATTSAHQAAGRGTAMAGPMQMAGHAEDLCFVGKWLVKRADAIEIGQYQAGEVPDIAPAFKGPFYSAQAAVEFLRDDGETLTDAQKTKIYKMAETVAQGGKGFMMLANATTGMTAPVMRDLKMGIHTASGTDQVRHGTTGLALFAKIVQHDVMDTLSGSAERGYRDEDRWKSSKIGDNTDVLRAMLARASLPALQAIDDGFRRFFGWLKSTKVVYVGMSLLVVAGGDTGRVAAVDFEHPIRDSDASFGEHRRGLLLGTYNLGLLVQGYIASFEARRAAALRLSHAQADADRQVREQSIFQGGGSINASGEGNAAIGNHDL